MRKLNMFVGLVCLLNLSAYGQYSGGDGLTEETAYQINSVADWTTLRNTTGDWDKYFILTANLDFGGAALTPVAPDTSTSAGFQGTKFTGVFDGAGRTLRNFYIYLTGQSYVGLFGCVGSDGQIRNLGMRDVDITGLDYVGGLAGWNEGGIITSCYARGAISGNQKVGGLVGSNGGTITGCYTSWSVSGTSSYVGGLVGTSSGTITHSYATGVVSGTDFYVGGLVGTSSGTITYCYATGAVSGTYDVGGLAGKFSGTITYCYATGAVNGTFYVGGLSGRIEGGMIRGSYATGAVSGTASTSSSHLYVGGLAGNSSGTITYCYATGTVCGTASYSSSYCSVGGLVGLNSGTILACYATGTVSGTASSSSFVGGLVGTSSGTITHCYATGTASGTSSSVGGLVGRNDKGKIIHCYSLGKPNGTSSVGGLCGSKITGGDYWDTGNFWDTQTSEIDTSAMGTGKLTDQMKTKSTFTGAGWDFVNVWTICEKTNYPRLLWQVNLGDWVCPEGVGFEDFAYFASRWLLTNCDPANNDCGGADLNYDGQVNLLDFAVFSVNWLKH